MNDKTAKRRPGGLVSGEEIDQKAGVLAVTDVYDALVAHRPCRAGRQEDKVLTFIGDNAKTTFHPEVVRVFLTLERFADNREEKLGLVECAGPAATEMEMITESGIGGENGLEVSLLVGQVELLPDIFSVDIDGSR